MDNMLFQSIAIKGMKLKNRIAFPPFLNNPVGEDGAVTDKTIWWFEEKAKGGAGLIVTGAIRPTTLGLDFSPLARAGLSLYDDKFIPGWAKLAEVIHSHDVKLGVQIAMLGPFGGLGMSPPPYPDKEHARDRVDMLAAMPVREITVEEIEQLEDDFAATAARAKAARIDCVELHCAHGGATLHCSSISPYYNWRTDKYGGNWEGRLRFPVETIKKMREAVGEDYPIFVRINADDLLGKRGITLEDATSIIVPALEKAGVDCFDVSQGSIIHAPQGIQINLYYPRGCFIHYAAAVKQVTKLPVIGVGRIFDLDMAEKFLQEGKADVIYLGRQLVADPQTPTKYFEGHPEDIRQCIGCNEGCGPCTVNYDLPHNDPIPLTAAEKPKKVLVIGGGVGGMEAARIAALRGHKVALVEKDSELGGMVAALALNPLTAEFRNIVDFLATQMRKLGVEVRICKEATVTDIEELNPDAVILATGASPMLPEVARGKPGVMTHEEALRRRQEIGQKVVIWGVFGAELAISLAEEGKDVILLCKAGEGSLGTDVSQNRQLWILRKLTDINYPRETPEAVRVSNPEVFYHVEVEDITPEGIRISHKEGKKKTLPYDTLILSQRFGERKANDSLFDELQGKVAEVHKIGDCSEVRGIREAIWSANEVARRI